MGSDAEYPLPPDRSKWSFGQALKWHLFYWGTRPEGSPDQRGKLWDPLEFADEAGTEPRNLDNWLRDANFPVSLKKVDDALFGDSPRYNDWRAELRRLWKKKRTGLYESDPVGTPLDFALPPEIPPRNLGFVGREDELERLHALLMGGQATAPAPDPVTLSGMGGVGKTSLAAAYMRRYGSHYGGLWWCRAETPVSLLASLSHLYGELEPQAEEEPDLAKAAATALHKLGRMKQPWLIVYDNAPALEKIRDFLPPGGVRLLITSRSPFWSEFANSLPVDMLPLDKAMELLKWRAPKVDHANADILAETLGRLPLALVHAAAFCESSGISFAEYATRVADLIAVLPQNSAYPTSIAATFDIAIADVVRRIPAGDTLMAFLAQCAPERIPISLARGAIADDSKRQSAISAFAEVSLIKHDAFQDGTPAITVHRLVRSVACARYEANGSARIAKERLIKRLSELVPEREQIYHDHRCWQTCDQLIPHVFGWLSEPSDDSATPESWSRAMQRAVRYPAAPESPWSRLLRRCFWWCIPLHRDPLEAWPDLVNRTANYLFARASYAEALQLQRGMLAFWEEVLGPTAAGIATPLQNLANVLQHSGDLAAAQPLLERALAISEATCGSDHPDTAAVLEHLASLASQRGDVSGARPFCERALAIRERTFGPEHPATAASFMQLAFVLRDEGSLDHARELGERALSIEISKLGEQHHETVRTLGRLAIIYQEQGNLASARRMLERVLANTENELGPEHPQTALDLNNLARVIQDQGDLTAARPLLERTLEIRQRTLGPEHHATAASVHNLAGLYEDEHDLEAARRLYERAVTLGERALGPTHPHVALSLMNLGTTFERLGEYHQAQLCYQRGLDIYEDTFGPEHPRVRTGLSKLGSLLRERGNLDEALPLLERSLRIAEKTLGAEAHESIVELAQLARLFRDIGKLDDARSFYGRALPMFEKIFGPDHDYTGTCLCDLAQLMRMQGEMDGVRGLYERALAIATKSCGPDGLSTVTITANFADFLREQGNLVEARALMPRALELTEKLLSQRHPDTNRLRCCFARLLLAEGEFDEALKVARDALAFHEEVLGADHPQTVISAGTVVDVFNASGRTQAAEVLATHYRVQLKPPPP